MAPRKTPDSSSLTTCNLSIDPARLEQTVKWLLTGARDADVLEAIRTQWPDQAVPELIAAAVNELEAAGHYNRRAIRGWCFESTKDLYRRMVEIGDFAGALRAIKQLYDLAA